MSTLGKIANGINDDLILFGGENVNLLEPLPRRHAHAASYLGEAHRAATESSVRL